MLNLIYGVSGSGKTAAITDAIRRDIQTQTKCYLLVPEQQAYISERDLASELPSNAGLYFEVVNFSKLAEKVFRQCGGAAQISTKNGIRAVIVWETLRQLSPLLTQYGKSKADATLTSEMLSTLGELQNNGITAEDLERAALQTDEKSPLHKKL
ncbi:MAG: hypothetical protein IKC59_04985, partial [Clostridia bacterium]|nr:hypothetical protein [Clostridia bacterium]